MVIDQYCADKLIPSNLKVPFKLERELIVQKIQMGELKHLTVHV